MHLLDRLETPARNNPLGMTLRSFVAYTLTLLCVLVSAGVAAYGQSAEFPIYPKYQVMGVVYAPPGSASSVTYGNSNLVGSTNSIITNSTNDSVTSASQTTGFSLFGFGHTSTTTKSDDWGTASNGSTSYSMQTTTGNSVSTMGPVSSSLGVNHDNDIIYVWLNPVVLSTVTASSLGAGAGSKYSLNWSGMQFNSCDLTDVTDTVNFLQLINGCDPNQYPYPDIVGIPVWCLKNPYYPGQACAQWLPFTSRSWDLTPWDPDSNGLPTGPGLTAQDYADILRADPFVSQTIAPDTFTAGYYCHPTYGVNLDPNDTETIPNSTTFPTTVLKTGSTWPTSYCGTSAKTMLRFEPYGTVQYPVPGVNGEPQTYSGTFNYTTASVNGQSATSTYSHSYNHNVTNSFAFSANFVPLIALAGPVAGVTASVFAANLSAGFNLSFSNGNGYSYSNSKTIASTTNTGATNSAAYSITGPQSSDNYTGPIIFDVYTDNVYGTFAFYSNEQRQLPAIQLSMVSGQSPIQVYPTSGGTIGTPIPSFGTLQVGQALTTTPYQQGITIVNYSPNPMTMVAPAVSFGDPGFQIVPGTDTCSNVQLSSNGTGTYSCTLTVQFAPVLSDAPNTILASYPVKTNLIAAGTENVTTWENILVTSTGVIVSGISTPAATTIGATLLPATPNTNEPNIYNFATPSTYVAQTEQYTFKNYYSSSVTFPVYPGDIISSDPADFSVLNTAGALDGCSGATITSGGTCSFTLQYLPTTSASPAQYGTKLTAQGTVTPNTIVAPLAVAGAAGTAQVVMTVSPNPMTFSAPANSEQTIALTITNTSTYSISNLAPEIITTNYDLVEYMGNITENGVVANCPVAAGHIAPATIAPGTHCQTALVYVPKVASGTFTGTFPMTGTLSNSANSTVSIMVPFTATITTGAKINFSGAEQSKTTTTPAKHGKGSVTVSGSVNASFTGTRSLVLTVAGFKAKALYSATDTSATVAKVLATAVNAAGSPVKATVSGDVVKLTSKIAGTAGNLSYTTTNSKDFAITPKKSSLSGGADAVTKTVYDVGSVDTAIGSVSVSSSWGKASTCQTIAKAVAASLNSAGQGAFTATVTDDTVTITPASKSPAPNVTVNVKDGMGFTPASFAASTN